MSRIYETIQNEIIRSDTNAVCEYLLNMRGIVAGYGNEFNLSYVGTTLQIQSGMVILDGRKFINTSLEEIPVPPSSSGTELLYLNIVLDGINRTFNLVVESSEAANIEDLSSNLINNPIEVISFNLGRLFNNTSGITTVIKSMQNIEITDIAQLAETVSINSNDIAALQSLHNDTGWVNLTYGSGYQPITPTSTLQYRIVDDFLCVRGTASPTSGTAFADGSIVIASGVDFTGYIVTGLVQLDSLGIYGGSGGSLPFKGTVEPDGRLVVVISPSSTSTGGTRSTYVAFNLVMPLDRA